MPFFLHATKIDFSCILWNILQNSHVTVKVQVSVHSAVGTCRQHLYCCWFSSLSALMVMVLVICFPPLSTSVLIISLISSNFGMSDLVHDIGIIGLENPVLHQTMNSSPSSTALSGVFPVTMLRSWTEIKTIISESWYCSFAYSIYKYGHINIKVWVWF